MDGKDLFIKIRCCGQEPPLTLNVKLYNLTFFNNFKKIIESKTFDSSQVIDIQCIQSDFQKVLILLNSDQNVINNNITPEMINITKQLDLAYDITYVEYLLVEEKILSHVKVFTPSHRYPISAKITRFIYKIDNLFNNTLYTKYFRNRIDEKIKKIPFWSQAKCTYIESNIINDSFVIDGEN
jgi:hypothetical protein